MSRSSSSAPMRSWLVAAGLVAAACALGGCGRSDWGYVEGVVTLEGEPVGPGTLLFEPAGPGQTKSAMAHFGEDGRYELMSPGDELGAPVGEYHVAVYGGGEGSFGEEQVGPASQSQIPRRYLDPGTSGLTATVQQGNNTIDFNLEP